MKRYSATLLVSFQFSDVLLLLLWLTALIVVSPFGEFPINDDWAYAKNVRHLAIEGEFVLDLFPAMNLISQTLYGCLFVKCFGFSFVTLRMSIFILCILSSFVLKSMVNKLNRGAQWFSLFFVVIFFFNPIMLELSFTFMTDMFFVSMIIFAIYFLIVFAQKDKLIHYFFFILFCVLAVLCRQHGLLFSFMSLFLLIGNHSKKKKLFLMILPPVLTWLAHDKYRHFMAEYHIANGINYSDKLFEYLAIAPFSNHLIHAADIVIVTGLGLLPLVALLLFSGYLWHRKTLFIGIPILLLVGYLVYYLWEHYPVGNITKVLQCGPRIVKVDSEEKISDWLEIVRKLQILAGGISFSTLLIALVLGRSALSTIHKLLPFIFSAITAMLFLFISISNAYFDRYSIPLILLLGVLLLPARQFTFDKRTGAIAISMGILLYSIAVIEVKDFFTWQDVRWKALNELNSEGITAAQIDGGFEYNGWHKPIDGWHANGKSWWWVKDDEFVVSTQRLKNYEVKKVHCFRRFISFSTDSFYVLKRKSKN